MPWRFSRMSWNSRFFKNKLKYYASATITTWPAMTLKNGLSHVVCPKVTAKERCRYSAHLAGVRKRGCMWGWRWQHCLTPHPAKEGDPVYTVQLQIQKPRSGHPRSKNILSLHAYLINLPSLAIASFFPTHFSSHHIISPPPPSFHFSPSQISP